MAKKVAKKRSAWTLTRAEKIYLYEVVRSKAVSEDNQFDTFIQGILRKLDR